MKSKEHTRLAFLVVVVVRALVCVCVKRTRCVDSEAVSEKTVAVRRKRKIDEERQRIATREGRRHTALISACAF